MIVIAEVELMIMIDWVSEMVGKELSLIVVDLVLVWVRLVPVLLEIEPSYPILPKAQPANLLRNLRPLLPRAEFELRLSTS